MDTAKNIDPTPGEVADRSSRIRSSHSSGKAHAYQDGTRPLSDAPHRLRQAAALSLPIFVLLTVFLVRLDLTFVFDPPFLLLILNTVFISAISFAVAYIAARSYLYSGLPSLLLLGSAVLMFGAGNFVTGWLIGPPAGPNVAVTIYNVAALLASILHLGAGLLAFLSRNAPQRASGTRAIAVLAYTAILFLVGAITWAALEGAFPPFFIQGSGPTILRQLVVATAILFFFCSSLLSLRVYWQSKSDMPYWYGLSNALIAVGLLAVFFGKSVGSPISWAGRGAQYLGGIYVLVSILTTIRRGRDLGIPLELAVSNSFRESETIYRDLVETLTDAVIAVDGHGNVLLWNTSAELLFGIDKRSAIGAHLPDLIPLDWENYGLPKVDAPLAVQAPPFQIGKRKELKLEGRNGSILEAEISMSARQTSAGRITTFLIRDIHDRKEAEHARALLANIVESSNDAIIGQKLDGTILSWNRGASCIYGYRSEEALGRSISMLIPPDHANDLPQLIDKMKKGERVQNYETVWIGTNGELIDIFLTLSPIIDATGAIIGASTIAHDITERKRAERELRKSQRKLETLFQLLPVGVSVLNTHGDIAYSNPALEKIVGLDQNGLSDGEFRMRSYIRRDGTPMGGDEFASARASREQQQIDNIITGIVKENGETTWTEVSAAPVNLADWSVIVVTADISKRVRAEQEIQALNQILAVRANELEAANKELEAFSYSVSHDLRAPLRGIDGFSRILLEDCTPQLSPEARRYLQIVSDNTRHMGILIDDLLRFSRISRQELNRTKVLPASLVRHCLEDLGAEKQGIHLQISIGDLCPCYADPALLKQVWMNLIANALKFTREREVAQIEIGCRPADGGETVYFVRDNGVGFDMQYVHKLFGVFQRLHRSEEFEGTGVGLAIVQRIVKRHGGRVWAEAVIDQGATFYFTLGDSEGG